MTLIIDYDTKERDRREHDRNTGTRSLLGTYVCQECGSNFGMHQVHRETVLAYPLRLEVIYRYRDDPMDADFVWESCPACQPNLDGFHPMLGGEFTAWLYGNPSAWDDRPERVL